MTLPPQCVDVSQATLQVLTDQQLAQAYEEDGFKVVRSRGRAWTAEPKGFYNLLNPLYPMAVGDIGRPTPWCWGYRATLRPEDADKANTRLRIHLMSDLEHYTDQSLSYKRRWHLRKCRKNVQIVQLAGPELLLEQGYDVLVSALERNQAHSPPPREQYHQILRTKGLRHFTYLAAVQEGKLLAYQAIHAADGAAYSDQLYLSIEGMRTSAGVGLVFEFAQLCRRTPGIRVAMYGFYTDEDGPLGVFKGGMGFPVVDVPCKVWLAPLVGGLIRWRFPGKYRRLMPPATTGQPIEADESEDENDKRTKAPAGEKPPADNTPGSSEER